MRYLLDTNVVIEIIRDPGGAPAQRLRTLAPADVAVSAIAMHELYYGAQKSARVQANLAVVDALQFRTLEFDREDAQHAGYIRAALSKTGGTIGAYDTLIAGQALARGLILVTHNRREFDRVPGVTVEDWQHGQ